MKLQFSVHIDLGYEAMQTGDDIERALMQVGLDGMILEAGDRGGIMDDNGNRVGAWEVLNVER